jgi:hypothetical protein
MIPAPGELRLISLLELSPRWLSTAGHFLIEAAQQPAADRAVPRSLGTRASVAMARLFLLEIDPRPPPSGTAPAPWHVGVITDIIGCNHPHLLPFFLAT